MHQDGLAGCVQFQRRVTTTSVLRFFDLCNDRADKLSGITYLHQLLCNAVWNKLWDFVFVKANTEGHSLHPTNSRQAQGVADDLAGH